MDVTGFGLVAIVAVIACVAIFKPRWHRLSIWLYRKSTADTIAPLRPDLSMDEAWRFLEDGLAQKTDASGDAMVNSYRMLDDSQRQSLRERLVEIEKEAASSDSPMEAVRLAFMDVASLTFTADTILSQTTDDRKALVEYFGEEMSDSQCWFTLAWGQIAITVLRRYLQLKYDDWGDKDWSEYFRVKVGYEVKHKVDAMVRAARGPGDARDMWTSFVCDSYSLGFEQLKAKVVHCPRKAVLDIPTSDEDWPFPE